MNKVIGTMTVKQEAILVGDHHIVTQGAIADGEAAFAGGTLLYKGEIGYQALASNDETNSPVAVALDALEAAASDAVVPIVVHGAVRREKLCFKGGTAITDKAVEALRTTGIYAL